MPRDAERDTYRALDGFGSTGSLGARQDAESAHPSNDGGAPMSDKVLRIIGCDIGTGDDQCARGFRSTTATLLNKEGVRQQWWKSISCTTRKKALAALAAPA
jgi:hypothetical protein